MTFYKIRVNNKRTCYYDTSKPLHFNLRNYFYCSVCGYKSHYGWSRLSPCPHCGAKFSVHFASEYTPEEKAYIMNKVEGCAP